MIVLSDTLVSVCGGRNSSCRDGRTCEQILKGRRGRFAAVHDTFDRCGTAGYEFTATDRKTNRLPRQPQ